MLRISKAITNASQAKQYYLPESSPETGKSFADYYANDVEVQGVWGGKAAAMLSLEGEVQQADFNALVDNQLPPSAKQTLSADEHGNNSLTPRNDANRRIANDLNFHAPKSLSLLWAMTDDQRIVEAFQRAVDKTMQHLEADARTRVRIKGANHDRVTGNMAWAKFTHFTARPVDGQLPDPHLHCHCVASNATFDSAENKFKALQLGRIKEDAPYFQAYFHAHLAQSIKGLGYSIRRTPGTPSGWEVAGIDRKAIEQFSKRTSIIEAKAKELGITNPDAKGELGAKTRQYKRRDLSLDQLKSGWRSFSEISDIKIRFQDGQDQGRLMSITPQQAIHHAMAENFERQSVVKDRHIKASAYIARIGENLADIDVALNNFKNEPVNDQPGYGWLTHTDSEGRRMVTTQAVLFEERKMIDLVRDGLDRFDPLVPDGIDRVIPERDGFMLNSQQQTAVRHVWTSADQVMVIRGAAGTGKSTLMQETVDGLNSVGKQVLPLAPTALAARTVLRDKGFANADTVASFLMKPEVQEQAKDQVIWVDEAGLLGARELGRVLMVAKQLNARVVLSGDEKQHAPVSRGDALRVIQKYAGVQAVEVTEIVRQQGSYKDAIKELSEGNADRAYAMLDDLGAIHEITGDKRYQQIAKDYVDRVTNKQSTIVVSPTHAEGKQVTNAIRSELFERGQLGDAETNVTRQRNLNWTSAQKRIPESYQPGQTIYFHKAAEGWRNGSWAEVVVPPPEVSDGSNLCDSGTVYAKNSQGFIRPVPIDKTDRFSVYQPEQLPLRSGDLIRFTQRMTGFNPNQSGKTRRVENGAVYTVVDPAPAPAHTPAQPLGPGSHSSIVAAPLDKQGKPDLKRALQLDGKHALYKHGYCRTSHAAQGWDADKVIVAMGTESFGATSREQFYVSSSRGLNSLAIYTDDKAGLQHAVQRSSERQSASELVEESGVDPTLELMREHQQRNQLEINRRLAEAPSDNLLSVSSLDRMADAPSLAIAAVSVTSLSSIITGSGGGSLGGPSPSTGPSAGPSGGGGGDLGGPGGDLGGGLGER